MTEEYIVDILKGKCTWDNYHKFQELEESINIDYYQYFDQIKELLYSEKSLIKVRAFKIICLLSKYDKENKIEKLIDELLNVLDDDKPTNVRMCLASTKILMKEKPHLRKIIINKLSNLDYSKYSETVGSLIKKDLDEILKDDVI